MSTREETARAEEASQRAMDEALRRAQAAKFDPSPGVVGGQDGSAQHRKSPPAPPANMTPNK